jgi:hypothetical protein
MADRAYGGVRRLTTETKQALKTTEFWAMVAVIAGILVSAAAIKGGDNGTDEFIARHAWLYVSIVAGAYFISRGLAKSGSRDPYFEGGTNENRDQDRDGARDGSAGERVAVRR